MILEAHNANEKRQNMDPKIKLLKDWNGEVAGTIVQVDEATAKSLILAEVAEEFDAKAQAAEEAKKASEAAQVKAVEDAVAKAVAEQLKNIETPEGIRLHVEVDHVGDAKPFKSFGGQLQAIKAHATGEATDEIDNRLKAASGANELVDSEGGFLVQQDFTNELQQNAQETGILASRVATREVSGNGLKWNELDDYDRTDGNHPVQTYWIEEAGTKTASKPDFIRRNMELEKLVGLYYATDELLEDAVGLEGMVSEWFGNEFGWKLDESIYNGNGAGVPRGLLQSAALVTVAKESGQTNNTIVAENVVKMFARMPARHQGGAVWLINQDAWPQLPLMTIGEQPVYLPPTGLIDAPAGLLLGKPVVLLEQAKSVGTLGDIMYVNLDQYLMIRKGGIKANTSIHVRFVNDEMTFRFVLRTNGDTKWSKSMTPQNGSNNLSPYVTLAARTA
jgi:HK97 family phage major capsid protein